MNSRPVTALVLGATVRTKMSAHQRDEGREQPQVKTRPLTPVCRDTKPELLADSDLKVGRNLRILSQTGLGVQQLLSVTHEHQPGVSDSTIA